MFIEYPLLKFFIDSLLVKLMDFYPMAIRAREAVH